MDEMLYAPMRYKELTEKLPLGEAIAIPHHLAYALGHRGKNWSTHDSKYSPFVEIFLSHGLMACYAEDYTRDSIFDALLNRRVYGVTGSKTKLYYTLNENIMGSIIEKSEENKYEASVKVECGNAIDRIEFIRNGIAENTYVHNGTWEEKELTGKIKIKFKTDFGWGPDLRIYPDITTKNWTREVVTEGKILSVEKLWTNPGQKVTEQTDKSCKFELTTKKTTQSGKWMGSSGIQTEGFIFEVEADVNSEIKFIVNGKEFVYKIYELLEGTKLNGFVNEAKELAKGRFGFEGYYRTDPFWHNAYKFKINQAFPEIAYSKEIKYTFEGIKTEKDFFMVKIYQKNGEVAWASPVFIR